MSTIRFELRQEKKAKDGTAPIRLIYQISGQRKYYNTGEKILPEYWDADNQRAIYLDKKAAKKALPAMDPDLLPTEKEVKELNAELQAIRKMIDDIEHRFQLDKAAYSAEMVVERLGAERAPLARKAPADNKVFALLDQYIEDHKATREPGTLVVFKSLKGHLQGFQAKTGRKVAFDAIDYSFFQAFQRYLIEDKVIEGETVRGLLNTTAAKQLSTLKTFLNYVRKQGIDIPIRYKDFTIKREALEVIALTDEEFRTLYDMDLSGNKCLEQVRDVFCFACATGFRYSDMSQLKREHIKEGEIRLTVKKTREPITVPLNPFSLAILEKYREQHRPLPIISNQKMNDYLKKLCQKAEITEPVEIVRFRGAKREAQVYPKYDLIGVHTGRKTFATLSLERGMSAEEVMACTGHKDYKSFKRYVKITEQRKKTVMMKAWGNIAETKLKAV